MLGRVESVNLVQQRHSTGNPASNAREYARPLRYYRFKVKRISRTWQSELSRRVDSARAFVRQRSALSGPTKRPSNPTYRFRHSNLTRIPANVLSRPDKDRILRRDKEPPPSVSSRFPDVPVTSGLKNASCLGCKSPSRFQRELDSRSRQTSLMSRPFGRGIRALHRSSASFMSLHRAAEAFCVS